MTNQTTPTKPTAFDQLRFGYFDTAFGNLLKAIRGGTNPIGVMTLAMCSISALSEIEWSIVNQLQLKSTGELPEKKQLTALGYQDKAMFEGWLKRWICDSGINPKCDPAKVYGVRCALVHTSGASETLSKTGVKAWRITVNEPEHHYSDVVHRSGDVPRFSLEMPEFLAELALGTDRFLTDNKSALEAASAPLLKHISAMGLPLSADLSVQLVNNLGSLGWFDPQLSESPLQISRELLSEKIRASYNAVKHLVLQ